MDGTGPSGEHAPGILAGRGALIGCAALVVLAVYHLTAYPLTWFDEGIHLHVPKTLVRFGVYADYSSDGFRHYGPTIGVGPTVMLPVAAAFWAGGIGLLQARLVMAAFFVAAVAAAFLLARRLGGPRLAWAAAALLVTSRGVSLVEYGRQVLGEVPGLALMFAGLLLWFSAWSRPTLARLVAAGLLLGLATVTKHVYLLVLAPTLLTAWILNLVYYRTSAQRVFLVPGIVTATCFAAWQACLIAYLGPATAAENLRLFREFTAGAALVFSPDIMARALGELTGFAVFAGALWPALIYGAVGQLRRNTAAQQWGVLWWAVVFNLSWFVVASTGWPRYAFPGLAIGCFLVARLFHDVTDGFRWPSWRAIDGGAGSDVGVVRQRLQAAALAWLVLIIIVPSGMVTVRPVVFPPENTPAEMAEYLDGHVPTDALVETWEPELGFLTDHRYHSPPARLLLTAVQHVWQGGPSPRTEYDFTADGLPEYVLEGAFSRYTGVYASDVLGRDYRPVVTIGAYELHRRIARPAGPEAPHSSGRRLEPITGAENPATPGMSADTVTPPGRH